MIRIPKKIQINYELNDIPMKQKKKKENDNNNEKNQTNQINNHILMQIVYNENILHIHICILVIPTIKNCTQFNPIFFILPIRYKTNF